jgi:hypothetical protein
MNAKDTTLLAGRVVLSAASTTAMWMAILTLRRMNLDLLLGSASPWRRPDASLLFIATPMVLLLGNLALIAAVRRGKDVLLAIIYAAASAYLSWVTYDLAVIYFLRGGFNRLF